MLNDSKLILDPDLDSYSAMDAWLLRVPVILDVATRASSQIAAESPHGGRAELDLAVELSSARTDLEDSLVALKATSHSCEARPTTRRPHTRWARRSPGSRTRSHVLDRSLRAGTRASRLPATGVSRRSRRLPSDASSFTDAYPVVLDRLLHKRAAGINGQLEQSFLIAALVLAARGLPDRGRDPDDRDRHEADHACCPGDRARRRRSVDRHSQ